MGFIDPRNLPKREWILGGSPESDNRSWNGGNKRQGLVCVLCRSRGYDYIPNVTDSLLFYKIK